jgi:hypothetical protein
MLVQMSSKTVKFFLQNIIESSLDEESDGETELLFAAASMAHDHYLLPKCRGGSSVKCEANTDRDRVDGHTHLM